jgi:hypothetical protein
MRVLRFDMGRGARMKNRKFNIQYTTRTNQLEIGLGTILHANRSYTRLNASVDKMIFHHLLELIDDTVVSNSDRTTAKFATSMNVQRISSNRRPAETI